MANNNECALSKTSGYTSNSNSTNNFDLKEINGIELNRVTYGADLSERLEDINENFNKIIESDFLRGAPGRSIGIGTWVFNNETKDTPMGQSLIDAIMSNNLSITTTTPSTTTTTTTTTPAPSTTTTTTTTPEIDPLESAIVGALINKEIKVIYDEDGIIVSSLPFTFIDPRFSSINMKEYAGGLANETDLSCVLVYETTNGSNGFVAAQTFPTLYWDTNIDGGNFCWKINGQKTGLPCKGPQGNDGSGGTLYTVLYDPEEIPASNGTVACKIVGVMTLNGTNVSNITNEFIPKNDFKERQVVIKTGDTVIAIPGSIDDDGNVSFAPYSNSPIGTTVTFDPTTPDSTTPDSTTYMYSITTVFVTNDDVDNYYVVIGGHTIHIPLILNGGTLANLMNKIGEDYMLGLYIPSEKSDGSDETAKTITKAHTLWTDRDNPSNLCIGEVANPAAISEWVENPALTDRPSSVSLLYDGVSVGKDVKMNISTHLENGSNIVKISPDDKRNISVEAWKFKGYYHPGLRNASGLIAEYDFQSSVSIAGLSYNFSTCQLIRVGGEFEHVTHIIDNSEGEEHFILWKHDLEDFEQFLRIWFDCKINGEDAEKYIINLNVIDVQNLRFEDGMYVCDGYSANVKPFTFLPSMAGAFMIDEVECDDINVTYGGIEYTIKSNSQYKTLSSPTLTITTDIDTDKRMIIPFEYRDIYESFLITEFTTSKDIEQVYVNDAGENKFDTYPNKWSPKYRLSPYRYSFNPRFDKYDGTFTDQYNISSHSQYASFDESYIGGQNIRHYQQILDEVIAYEIPENIYIYTETLAIPVTLSIPLIQYNCITGALWGSIYAAENTLYLIGYSSKSNHIQLLRNMADAAFKGYKYTITANAITPRIVGGEDTTPGTQSFQILSATKSAFDADTPFNTIISGTVEVPANIHPNTAKLVRKYSTTENTWVLQDGNFAGHFKPLEYIAPYININSADAGYWMIKSTAKDPTYAGASSSSLPRGIAPDGYKYKLIFPKASKYVLGYEYDTKCIISNEWTPFYSPIFSTNIEWYGEGTSRSTNIEKVTYRCKEFQLNDYDLITKIAKLEARIKALEDNA